MVVSTAQLQELHGLWVVMITSAENRGWPDDVPVANLKLAGLPVPSLIRSAKIATIDASDGSRARSDRGWGPRKRCTLGTGQNQIPPHVYGAVEAVKSMMFTLMRSESTNTAGMSMRSSRARIASQCQPVCDTTLDHSAPDT